MRCNIPVQSCIQDLGDELQSSHMLLSWTSPTILESQYLTHNNNSGGLCLTLPPALDFMFVGTWLLCDYYTWPANNNNNNMFLAPATIYHEGCTNTKIWQL